MESQVVAVPRLGLRRYGDLLIYTMDDQGLAVAGKHLFGSRYDLRFGYSDLRPEYQVFWLPNRRDPLQLSLVFAFFVVFGVCWAAMRFFPETSVAIGAAISLALLAVALAVTLLPGRVRVLIFQNRSGVQAFQIPTWGCEPKEHAAFVDALCQRISAMAPSGGP
jgi:hypothetical protein